VRGGQCDSILQRMTNEEQQMLHGRCAIDGQATQDATVICKKHGNEWLHRYKPTRCAACPNPLSISASRPCPEWMREQLNTHHGAFVHKRPCYEKALAAKKQQAVGTQPMEVEQENQQQRHTFQINVRQHKTNTRNNIKCMCTLTSMFSVSLCV